MRDLGAVESPAVRPQPSEPARFAAFARFFKGYMGTAALVTASLPIPVSALQLIPAYAAQSKYLSTYTSMFCFLMLGYFFYIRHSLGTVMFFTRADGDVGLRTLVNVIPFLLILASLALVALYHHYLLDSLAVFSERGIMSASSDVLKSADLREIPNSLQLTLCYVGMFLTAEAAFILMALREYLQDVLGIQDVDLIRLPQSGRRPQS